MRPPAYLSRVTNVPDMSIKEVSVSLNDVSVSVMVPPMFIFLLLNTFIAVT